MSQKKMTFSQKFQKAKSSGSFSAALMLAPAVFFLTSGVSFACVPSIRLSGFSAM